MMTKNNHYFAGIILLTGSALAMSADIMMLRGRMNTPNSVTLSVIGTYVVDGMLNRPNIIISPGG